MSSNNKKESRKKLFLPHCFLLTVLFCLFLWGCEEEKEPETQGSRFLFYPMGNIYEDLDRNKYYIFNNKDRRWVRKDALSKEESRTLGRSVKLQKVSVPVYRDNDEHKLIYGTLLYTSPTEMQRKYREDSLAYVARENARKKKEQEKQKEKDKSGFKKWLDRIFGNDDE